MPSPFPGMNPFLEHPFIFHNFHGSFAFALRDALVALLRPRYFIQVDENVYLHELSAADRQFLGRPDVGIGVSREGVRGLSAGVLEAPATGRHVLAVDELHETFLRIVDAQSREIITIIEILSPSNKTTDRDQYLAKRNRILKSSTHLVEFDFLRSGRRMPDESVPPSDYAIMVSRSPDRPRAGYWTFGVRDPLPTIPIPLRDDGMVEIHPKAVLDRVYDAAGYEDEIYTNPLQPPLSPEDAAWAASILAGARGG